MSAVLLGPMLLALAGGHAVADYGLQSAYMADNKVRGPGNRNWYLVMAAHCLIHAFMVLAITGLGTFAALALSGLPLERAALVACGIGTACGWLEFACHFAIDDAKGQKRFSYLVDQGLHYSCKLLWLALCAVTILSA